MRTSSLVVSFLVPAAYGQLNTLAKAAGLEYFGSATDNPELTDTAYLSILSNQSEFGQITPGNTQKWQYTEPTQNSFSFDQADVITSLAKNNSQLLRCHTLVWYSQLPGWVSGGTWTNETLIAAMKNHITTEVTHYKGQCHHWDVVNEALDPATGNFREDIFYKTIGPYYINIAFAAAAAADPNAKLYYNDYSIEFGGNKQANTIAIVKQLKDAGVRIDGVGIQGHHTVGQTPSQANLEKALKQYTDLGVEVAITELDIKMSTNSTENLAQQSVEYAGVTRACLNVDGCVGITIWDFDDKVSWITNTFPGFGFALPWNADLSKKPAYYSIVDALKSSNRTVAVNSTMAAGNSTAGEDTKAGASRKTKSESKMVVRSQDHLRRHSS